MKTALNIHDSVRQRLREETARRGTTRPGRAEAGLRRVRKPEVAAAGIGRSVRSPRLRC